MLRRDGTLAYPARIVLAIVAAAGLYIASTSDPFTTLFFVSYAVVGGILTIRRPKNLISWLLIALAFSFIGTTDRADIDIARVKAGTGSVGDEIWVWVSSWSGAGTFMLFTVLAATFPSGRLPVGRWRRAIVVALTADLVVLLLMMFTPRLSVSTNGANDILVPNPLGIIPYFPGLAQAMIASFVIVLGGFAVAVASLITRYRGAAETLRLQIQWLLASITFVLIGIVFGLVLGSLIPDQLGGTIWIPAVIAYPTVPIAIGVAILRYRLYEIDRIINRALVYGTVTAVLAGAFAAVTLLTQRIFVGLTGQRSDAAIVLTTLAVAALFAPLRKRVEWVVDRYFKYDQRLFGAYREELRRAIDVLAPAPAAHRLAREALAETGAIAAAVVGNDGAVVASAGAWPAEALVTIPVDAEGAPLTAVLLGARRDGRPHRPQAVAALGEVAALAAIASAAIPQTLATNGEAPG